jgi:hypothetical protein
MKRRAPDGGREERLNAAMVSDKQVVMFPIEAGIAQEFSDADLRGAVLQSGLELFVVRAWATTGQKSKDQVPLAVAE